MDFYVHERAICDTNDVGSGTRIWGFTHVMNGARIGKNCNIGEHVFVENEVVIGSGCTIKNGVALWDCVTLEDGVFVGPYCVFTNDLVPRAFLKRGRDSLVPTLIKRGATLGANSTFVCGIVVGEFAMVGAGCLVTKDIPPHCLVLGVPGNIVGRVCFCGERLDGRDFCRACDRMLSQNSHELTLQRFSSKPA